MTRGCVIGPVERAGSIASLCVSGAPSQLPAQPPSLSTKPSIFGTTGKAARVDNAGFETGAVAVVRTRSCRNPKTSKSRSNRVTFAFPAKGIAVEVATSGLSRRKEARNIPLL